MNASMDVYVELVVSRLGLAQCQVVNGMPSALWGREQEAYVWWMLDVDKTDEMDNDLRRRFDGWQRRASADTRGSLIMYYRSWKNYLLEDDLMASAQKVVRANEAAYGRGLDNMIYEWRNRGGQWGNVDEWGLPVEGGLVDGPVNCKYLRMVRDDDEMLTTEYWSGGAGVTDMSVYARYNPGVLA